MRYYEEKYPEVDDLVMVTVKQIAEMGAYVKLVSTQTVSLSPPILWLLSKLLERTLGSGRSSFLAGREGNVEADLFVSCFPPFFPFAVGVRERRGNDPAV